YTPIGQNIAFSTANSGVRAMDIIGKMTNAEDKGANFVRVWVNPWSISLQKKGYAPNDLTGGMRDAVQFDELLNAADELGMTVQLSLFTHTMFKCSGSSNEAGWNDCVYNSANTNGIISTPQAFFTNATAKKQTKDYLRYMVARYGYSDNLFAWELMNEADSTTNYDASAVAAWYTEMTEYLKSIDAYNHMVTSSATDASATQAAYNSAFDFASLHLYYDDGFFVDDFISTRIADEANDSKYDGKPVVFGELGYQDNGVVIVDNNNMHRQLWATLMSCGAAGASWCWDTIEENNLYSNYTAIKDFAQYIDFENTSYSNYKKAFINDTNAFGYVGSTSAYLWIYKRNYGDVSSASYTVNRLTNGTYTVKWIDTNTGYLVGSAQTKTVSNGSLTLNSPSFTNDIAVRVIKQ
ncbi:MAG: cellulase family glycosylhydrolase, partial [Ruminococcus sp.]|nr:cellulase family glycosylhydrolase [Candidatus Copronaster equi]